MGVLDMEPASVIAVSASKGGTGKSSLVTNLATLMALPGKKVLVIDMDTETGLGIDFGYYANTSLDDQGEGLRRALTDLTVPPLLASVRPGLDIVRGGSHLEHLRDLVPTWRSLGVGDNQALALIVEALRPSYDYVFIDTAPGESLGRELAFAAADHVLIPTRSDNASIAGVASVAKDFAAVADTNPQLSLLGVVLFGVNASATSIVSELRTRLDSRLGEGAVFDNWIRYQERTATTARALGMSIAEYERDVLANVPKVGEKGWKAARKGLASSAATLAGDYSRLALEIMSRLRSFKAEKITGRLPA